jgi:hypothetical protein
MNSPLTCISCQRLYSYVNDTSLLQIIRVVNTTNWFDERVIFPGQRLLFEAPPNVELEVYTSDCGRAILVKKIPGFRLEVAQGSSN